MAVWSWLRRYGFGRPCGCPLIETLGHGVHVHFVDVAKRCVAPGHVAVKRAITLGDFGFVSGGHRHAAVGIGVSHHQDGSKTSLKVLTGNRSAVVEDISEGGFHAGVHGINGVNVVLEAKGLGRVEGVINGVLRGMTTRHGQARHVRWADGLGGHAGRNRRINPTREPQHNGRNRRLAAIVCKPRHDGIGQFFDGSIVRTVVARFEHHHLSGSDAQGVVSSTRHPIGTPRAVQINHQHTFLPRWSNDGTTVRPHDKTAAVKEKIVVPPT